MDKKLREGDRVRLLKIDQESIAKSRENAANADSSIDGLLAKQNAMFLEGMTAGEIYNVSVDQNTKDENPIIILEVDHIEVYINASVLERV